jgi:hypothetical protein
MGLAGIAAGVTGIPGGGTVAEIVNDKLKTMAPSPRPHIPRIAGPRIGQ